MSKKKGYELEMKREIEKNSFDDKYGNEEEMEDNEMQMTMEEIAGMNERLLRPFDGAKIHSKLTSFRCPWVVSKTSMPPGKAQPPLQHVGQSTLESLLWLQPVTTVVLGMTVWFRFRQISLGSSQLEQQILKVKFGKTRHGVHKNVETEK